MPEIRVLECWEHENLFFYMYIISFLFLLSLGRNLLVLVLLSAHLSYATLVSYVAFVGAKLYQLLYQCIFNRFSAEDEDARHQNTHV